MSPKKKHVNQIEHNAVTEANGTPGVVIASSSTAINKLYIFFV